MQELYPIEIIAKDGCKRIGLSDMISRATYRDTKTDNPKKELMDWLKDLGIVSELCVKLKDRTYVLVEKRPVDLLKIEEDLPK